MRCCLNSKEEFSMPFTNQTEEKQIERAVLVGLSCPSFNADQDADERTMDELRALAETAGAEAVAMTLQRRPAPDARTFIGEGKAEEVKQLAEMNDASLILFDNELSPSQMSNLEELTGRTVLDRSALILDIFAQRARTGEGKLQVELAQYQYILPRLAGMGKAMSRLGGGIGTRGPGETKLETDRRHIRRRIESLKEELSDLEKHRQMLRSRRKKDGVITCAIVGYTNAGKSTLMNCLTDAGVLAQDKLFATLDPTSRALKLPSGVTVMMIDTVGLVRRLPHHLVEAFRSTLEEAAQSDIILNVCDASSDEARTHMQVTTDLLESLGCGDTPIITVLNKCDLLDETMLAQDFKACVRISAKNGTGIDELLNAIENNLPVRMKRVKILLPFAQAGLANKIRNKGTLIYEEYVAEGLSVEAVVDEALYAKLAKYECE